MFIIAYINSNYRFGPLVLVKDIEINYYGINKEDVFVGITRLIDYSYDIFKSTVYETNITNITNVLMGLFSFSMKFEGIEEEVDCCFRKYENTPLLLLCQVFNIDETHLSKIENEMILDDINIKYNFRIQPVNNNQTFNTMGLSFFFIEFSYPEILDFTYQDTFIINLGGAIINNPTIRLNIDADDLECEIAGENIFLICVVHKSHFKGKISGYYSLIHVDDDLNKNTIFYEIPPFKVILNESDADTDNIITVEAKYDGNDKIGKKGVIALKTSFVDENNIFDELDIEKRTRFTTKVSNENKEEFIINCNLFKFIDEPYLVFCELDESIPEGNYSINFEHRSFMYNNNKIIINSEKSFLFKKVNIDIINLYSDVQNINVKENEDTIEIKFNIISYHNEPLVILNEKKLLFHLKIAK